MLLWDKFKDRSCTDYENDKKWKDKTYVSEGEYAPGRVLDGSICRGQNGGAYRFGGKSVSYTNYEDVTETGITRMEHSWNCIEGE